MVKKHVQTHWVRTTLDHVLDHSKVTKVLLKWISFQQWHSWKLKPPLTVFKGHLYEAKIRISVTLIIAFLHRSLIHSRFSRQAAVWSPLGYSCTLYISGSHSNQLCTRRTSVPGSFFGTGIGHLLSGKTSLENQGCCRHRLQDIRIHD